MNYIVQNSLPWGIFVLQIFWGLFVCMRYYITLKYNLSGDSSLENELITKAKVFFINWLIESTTYIIITLFLFKSNFDSCKKFSGDTNRDLITLWWIVTIIYLLCSLFLCINGYQFCKIRLKYKKHDLLFIKFVRSIVNAIISWLLIIIFLYNNNKQIPFIILMDYITLSLVTVFFYPFLDAYQYTFEEIEKHEKEKKE